MKKFVIDGAEYDPSNASENIQAHLANFQFVNKQILQKNNELQIAETAKIGCSRALKRDLGKIRTNG